MAKYGKVESLGFAQDASRLRSQSWKRPELGEDRLGRRVGRCFAGCKDNPARIGRCLYGWSKQQWEAVLRWQRVRVRGSGNAVGWGSSRKRRFGRSFLRPKPNAVAKEDLLLKCEATNHLPIRRKLGAFVLGKNFCRRFP